MEIRQAQFCVRMKFLLLILRMPVWSMLEKNNNGTTNNNLKNILKIKKQKKKERRALMRGMYTAGSRAVLFCRLELVKETLVNTSLFRPLNQPRTRGMLKGTV